jgi:hypothetical protein
MMHDDYATDDDGVAPRGVNRFHTKPRSDSSLWFINYTPDQQPPPLAVNDISPGSSSSSSTLMSSTNNNNSSSSSSSSVSSSSNLKSSPQLLIPPLLPKIAERPALSSYSIRMKDEHQQSVKDKKVRE